MIGDRILHYEITGKLGAGGMGEVYLATDTKLERQVALKFLPESLSQDPESRERLLREARAASKLNHPNIMTVHAVEECNGRDFIVMEFLQGMTLAEFIEAESRPFEEILGIAIQIAEGLERAHRAGIVHRDLKPANVLIDTDGHAKILDFGLAKLQDAPNLTATGSTPGTAAYMSPEQTQGSQADHRSDLFSFGTVLYEMIAGRLPFPGEHVAAIAYSLVNEEPQPLARYRAGVPDDLQRIVAKCLAKKPQERYQSAGDLIVDLRHARHDSAPGVAAAIAPRKKMLAVLPFENLGPAEDEYFADGMTEEIISRLASVAGLGVISRTSVMQYKGTRKSIREISADLSVDFVLEGTVRWSRSPQSASRVRITPQLIQVRDDTHLWSERYDRVIEDIFEVQSEIAEKVTAQLNVALGEPERRAMEAKPTENMDAYNAYLRGLEYTGRPDYNLENHRLAIQMFGRACQLDGGFAQAHAYLAIAHSGMYFYGYDRTDERRAKSAASVDRAVALKPSDPYTHLALGFHHYRCCSDLDRALDEFTKVLQLQPNQVLSLFMTAMIHRRQGRFNEALDRARNVLQLDPLCASFAMETGITALIMRRYDEAEKYLDRSISLAPDQVNAFSWKSILYTIWRADLGRARAALEQITTSEPLETFDNWFHQLLYARDYPAALRHVSSLPQEHYEDQLWYWTKSQFLGEIHNLLGNTDEARSFYETALRELSLAAADRPEDPRIRQSLGLVHACLGHRDDAIREVQEAISLVPISKDALMGSIPIEMRSIVYANVGDHEAALNDIEYLLSIPSLFSASVLKLDPRFDLLRQHPRFQKLLEQPDKVF